VTAGRSVRVGGRQQGRAAGSPPGRKTAAPARAAAGSGPLRQADSLAAGWGPTAGRILLGLVLAWFGYHELVQPALWSGYVPFVHSASGPAVVLVLAHGWLLLVVSVALVAGIAVRAAAGLAALLVAQIVVWLTITAGLSDLTLRDAGVLGLALCLCGSAQQRFTLAS
jgi:uncharacterized membrane protein YphA (DoxX/SURF4 family)